MNSRLLGVLCVIGGLVYLTGGVWRRSRCADRSWWRPPCPPFQLDGQLVGYAVCWEMLKTYATALTAPPRRPLFCPRIGLGLVMIRCQHWIDKRCSFVTLRRASLALLCDWPPARARRIPVLTILVLNRNAGQWDLQFRHNNSPPRYNSRIAAPYAAGQDTSACLTCSLAPCQD